MSAMIQIRDVPDDLHRTLKKQADDRGMTLSGYIKAELELLAQRPTWDELVKRIESRPAQAHSQDTVSILRELRDGA